METYVSLTVTIDDETGDAIVKASVSKWEASTLVYNGPGYKEYTKVAPIGLDQSVYPYIVATIQTATRIVVDDLNDKIAGGQVALMHNVTQQLIPLRVAPGPAGLSRR